MMILPLSGTKININLGFFYRFLNHLLFSYSFIPNSFVIMGWNTYERYDFQRPETYLELLGVEHASSITNTAKLSTILAITIFIYF